MLTSLIFLCVSYFILYVLSLRIRDNSIVDIFWGIGFVGIAWNTLFEKNVFLGVQVLVTLLVTAWGVRLALNIASKKIPYKGEDRRYAAWRKEWKYFKIRSFLQVFVLQGLLMGAVATPIILLNTTSGFDTSLSLTMIGGLIALFGLLYESRADAELAGFIKNKQAGDILTSGLRRFHRYPQYFGESVFWFGICVIASQVSIYVFIGWIIITLLLRFVSGVPLMEKHYKDNLKFQKYSEYTPILFPSWNKAFCIK